MENNFRRTNLKNTYKSISSKTLLFSKDKKGISYIDDIMATIFFIMFVIVFLALLQKYFVPDSPDEELISFSQSKMVDKLTNAHIYSIPLKIDSVTNTLNQPIEIFLPRSLNIEKLWITRDNNEIESELIDQGNKYYVLWVTDIINSTNMFMINFIQEGDVILPERQSDISVEDNIIKNAQMQLILNEKGRLTQFKEGETTVDFSSDLFLDINGESFSLDNATDLTSKTTEHSLFTDITYSGTLNNTVDFNRTYRLYKNSLFFRITTNVDCDPPSKCVVSYSYTKPSP